MKISFTVLAAALIGVFIFGCGQQAEDLKQTMQGIDNASKVVQNADKMEETANKAKERFEQRKAKGDTNAVHFQKLIGYLPKSIPGYNMDEPNGQNFSMPGMSYSSANVRYENEAGNYIDIKITDFNQVYDLYTGAIILMQSGIVSETTDGWEKGWNPGVNDVAGWEKYSKGSKNANITMSVGFRFVVTIEADNQTDTQNLKNILGSMPLAEMAAL